MTVLDDQFALGLAAGLTPQETGEQADKAWALWLSKRMGLRSYGTTEWLAFFAGYLAGRDAAKGVA